MIKNLIIILGDQLTHNIDSLSNINPKTDVVLMMEVHQEATYVKHHKHKIILIFSAMRHFAKELKDKDINVHYIKFEDSNNKHSFSDNLYEVVKQLKPKQIIITEPGEYRVLEFIYSWQDKLSIPVNTVSDNRFMCSIDEFQKWAQDKTQLRMEYFYRMMRQKYQVLMTQGKPVGGKYNFDIDNRKSPIKGMQFPDRRLIKKDDITLEVISIVDKHFPQNMGIAADFNLAVTRKAALTILNDFIKNLLPNFGDYQDAMVYGEYNLFHSMISMYLNIGLLTAEEVIRKVEQNFYDNKVSISSAEGYIRQILGWREFIRGVYWLKMPEYKTLNYLEANEKLPWFYWSGEVDMACMKHSLAQTIQTATSHHIQRLMITGNFALLLGINSDEICEWYLAVYADAFEWVELPNTLGMSQFADGGMVASKPYISSGNYINKMSNFCEGCPYDVKKKLVDNACPFNDLYWAFLIKNKKKLSKNPRLSFPYKAIEAMPKETQEKYLKKRLLLIDKFCNSNQPGNSKANT